MGAETLPFSISPEARDGWVAFLDHMKEEHDRAHIPHADRGFPTLIWSIGSEVDDVAVGPEIGLGTYGSLRDAEQFSFTLGEHRVWVGERTLSLLRGRTLIRELRTVPAPIYEHRCFWVDPAPDDE